MRRIKFKDQEFYVPDWANYITWDCNGFYAWERKPLQSYNSFEFGKGIRHNVLHPIDDNEDCEIMEIT